MASIREISEVVRGRVLILKKESYSTRKIARKLKILKTGVICTIKRLLTTRSFRLRHRSERPKSINLRVDNTRCMIQFNSYLKFVDFNLSDRWRNRKLLVVNKRLIVQITPVFKILSFLAIFRVE